MCFFVVWSVVVLLVVFHAQRIEPLFTENAFIFIMIIICAAAVFKRNTAFGERREYNTESESEFPLGTDMKT